MVLTIRPAAAADADQAATLLNAIIATGGTTAIETQLTPAEVMHWFLLPGPEVWCCHVAEQDGRIIGFQAVERSKRLPETCGEMATYAQPGHHQKGIGTALFAASSQAAKALGLTHLNALIRNDNTGGLSYYSRMGFGDDKPGADVTLKSGAVINRVNKRLSL
jgi:L-amino acid N-acyltransferase YncA